MVNCIHLFLFMARWVIIEEQESRSAARSGEVRGSVESETAAARHGILHHLRRIGHHSGLSGNFHLDLVQSAAVHHQATGKSPIITDFATASNRFQRSSNYFRSVSETI